uniref:Uncharacterized protein n=1 Tax=Rhizophagus irregularis (strain DAOM 181602 / DAOM 197198 / MUCL 43194) TaxID=747089 RepID=U9U996_RHIID
MVTLFRLTTNNYIDLSRFNRKLANTANYEKILKHILKDIAIKHKTCIHITSVNETPEYELSESHNKGPVDWLQVLSQHNKKKRIYNEALRENVMYDIVLIGINWIIIKLVTTSKCMTMIIEMLKYY